MENLAYRYDYESYELINGEQYMMARPNINHVQVELNITSIFDRYLEGKVCRPFNEADVFLNEENNVVPDVMIVCDPEKVEDDGIHGAPDLIVEILSKSTAKRDTNDKFKLYEKCGVKEYWIVDPFIKSVTVYHLINGKYEHHCRCQYFTPEQYESLSVKDKADVTSEIKVSLYDDFVVQVKDIFKRVK